MNAKIVYKDYKDRELLDLNNLTVPIFIEYIDITTRKGKKEGWSILNYYGTTQTPFVELQLDNGKYIVFYNEKGNAIYQLINYINNSMVQVKFKKLNENARIPEFKHPDDAGKDLFPTSIKYNEKYDRLEYGLGFATAIPKGYEITIRPRSSQTKKDWYIPNAPGTIDANYRGEWFVMFKHRLPFEQLFPNGDKELNILELINELAPFKPGEAIAQALLHKREDWEFVETEELDETDRGTDGGLNREGA